MFLFDIFTKISTNYSPARLGLILCPALVTILIFMNEPIRHCETFSAHGGNQFVVSGYIVTLWIATRAAARVVSEYSVVR